MFFGRTKKQPVSPREQLAAKPVRLFDAEMKLKDDGGGELKISLKRSRFLFVRLPEGATKTFEFDAIGVLVWESCDGKTSIQQIIRKLAKRYNLGLREAQVPTLAFLRTLMRKGLVGVAVKKEIGSK
ncbi:MAG: PqqD family protein [Tepidisphaeraceae bacterium]